MWPGLPAPPFATPVPHLSEFSTSGATKIYFDIELPAATSSVAVPAEFAEVASLFTPCHGPGNAPIGCAALPSLVLALQQYGLPVTAAYYNDN